MELDDIFLWERGAGGAGHFLPVPADKHNSRETCLLSLPVPRPQSLVPLKQLTPCILWLPISPPLPPTAPTPPTAGRSLAPSQPQQQLGRHGNGEPERLPRTSLGGGGRVMGGKEGVRRAFVHRFSPSSLDWGRKEGRGREGWKAERIPAVDSPKGVIFRCSDQSASSGSVCTRPKIIWTCIRFRLPLQAWRRRFLVEVQHGVAEL